MWYILKLKLSKKQQYNYRYIIDNELIKMIKNPKSLEYFQKRV